MSSKKNKGGRPPLTPEEKHRRVVERARKRTAKALTKHLDKKQKKLWDDLGLVGDFDLSTIWRMAMMELHLMDEEYAEAVALGLGNPVQHRRRKGEYLELCRKLAVAAKDIMTEPISELVLKVEGLTSGGIWADEDGNFIPPPDIPDPEMDDSIPDPTPDQEV